MDTLRLILATIVLLFAGHIVAMNWVCVIVSIRNRRRGIDRHYSTVPVISFILAGVAHITCPKADKNWMFVIPVLDIANGSLLMLPFVLLRERRKQNAE
jgi:hypothetical protein